MSEPNLTLQLAAWEADCMIAADATFPKYIRLTQLTICDLRTLKPYELEAFDLSLLLGRYAYRVTAEYHVYPESVDPRILGDLAKYDIIERHGGYELRYTQRRKHYACQFGAHADADTRMLTQTLLACVERAMRRDESKHG